MVIVDSIHTFYIVQLVISQIAIDGLLGVPLKVIPFSFDFVISSLGDGLMCGVCNCLLLCIAFETRTHMISWISDFLSCLL